MAATSHDEQLLKIARQVTRLENRAKDKRRELKLIMGELKARRKELKAYTQNLADGNLPAWNERGPKLRTMGDR